MMKYLFVLIGLSIATCEADNIASPVLCGVTPNAIYQCLGTPKVVKKEASSQCDSDLGECEKMSCIFSKSGWMKGNKVDKEEFAAHFDQFAKENPDWKVAVEHMKSNCLSSDLPPQGVHLNCPAYDVMICAFANFIKGAPASQWSSSSQCEYPRRFAASCPVCPTACFASAIPIGSCNACLSLPRSP
ncbi:general odorant-binding protein 68 [Danaus plexippus]|uniref:general odorant-binding protein 68 n=1 Tax=Danaus plexippus TaxID=13037 RepID=UPI002AB13789|nr:general odorant-binding protein 68 [Danaus plexippus]